ncbi:MAG TPA: VCBS repeat-containing protein [Kofleriaceae bacterium]|nr:VCBS repeat-containing protein [Kofleriaceae bacterium]
MARQWWAPAVLVALCAACNPGVFDDLKGETWVNSASSPDDLGSNDFGSAIVWTGAQPEGTAVAVTGAAPAGVAHMVYAADGSASAEALTIGDLISGGTLGARPAMAADIVTTDGEEGTLAVAVIEAGGTSRLLLIDPATMDVTETQVAPAGVIESLAFAASDADAAAGTVDLFGAGESTIAVVADYQSAARTIATCDHARERTYALAVGPFLPEVGDAVVASIGTDAMFGEPSAIVVFSGFTVTAAAANDQPCFAGADYAVTLDAPGEEPDFGLALATGDFDGSGELDLAASAPSAGVVYVWLDPATNSFDSQPVVIAGPAGSVDFGHALTAADLDGDGTQELAVADDAATVEGTQGAGAVYVYAGLAGPPAVTLYDAEPETDEHFGRAVAGAPFKGATDDEILMVGTGTQLFTYFQTPLAGDTDPRQ